MNRWSVFVHILSGIIVTITTMAAIRYKDDIYTMTKCLHFLAKIFGYWPFSIVEHESVPPAVFYVRNYTSPLFRRRGLMTIETKPCDFIWCLITLTYYVACVYAELMSIQLMERFNYSTVEVVMNMINIMSFCVISVVTIAMDMLNRKQIWDIIIALDKFDQTVNIIRR